MFGNLINKAMSKMGNLPALARSMIEKDIQVYDASRNSVIIAGREMTGWETAHIADLEVSKEYVGLDSSELAIVKQAVVRKLSMSFLPTDNSILKLEELYLVCRNYGKFFKITILENGTWVGDYYAQFASVGGIRMQAEGENVSFEFFLKAINVRAAETLLVTPSTPVADEPNQPIVVTPLPLPPPQ